MAQRPSINHRRIANDGMDSDETSQSLLEKELIELFMQETEMSMSLSHLMQPMIRPTI